MIILYIIFTLSGSIFNLLSIGLNVCLLEWIGKFGFFFTSRLIQLIISIEILISLYRPGMIQEKRKKIRIILLIIFLLYGLLNVIIPPSSKIVSFNSYISIDNNVSICYQFEPNGLILLFEFGPFVLCTLFALVSLILSIVRTKKISKANNKNRRSRIIFYSTMVLVTGLVRLGSLPEQIYFLLNDPNPLAVSVISSMFLHLEPILVFLACCINNSIPSRIYKKIFPPPDLEPSPLYEKTGNSLSNPSIDMDGYSLGSYPKNITDLPI